MMPWEVRMVHRIAFCLLLLLSFLGGCAAPIGQVTTNYDKFKDSTAEIVQVGQTVRLIRIAEKTGAPTYAFIIEGASSGNRAALPDELVFLLDGDQLKLKGGSSLEDVSVSRYGVHYYERAIFPVSGDQILRVSRSSKVEVRMYGRNGAFPGVVWDEPRIKAVGKFHWLFVQRDWDRMSEQDRAAASKPGTGS